MLSTGPDRQRHSTAVAAVRDLDRRRRFARPLTSCPVAAEGEDSAH
jgi:hypothetical protein